MGWDGVRWGGARRGRGRVVAESLALRPSSYVTVLNGDFEGYSTVQYSTVRTHQVFHLKNLCTVCDLSVLYATL